jgi:hypothetical protein
MKVLLVAGTTLMFLMLCLALFIYYRTSRHRKNAIMVLPVRPVIKLLSPLIGVLAIWTVAQFPQSLILAGYILAFVLVPFSIDIIIENDGVYFGLKLIPWGKIKKISDHSLYLMITTHQNLDRKGFLKLIWKISAEDIKRIECLLTKKKLSIEKSTS